MIAGVLGAGGLFIPSSVETAQSERPTTCVFSRYTNRLRFFQWVEGRYQEQPLDAANPRAWLPELNLGLGVWHGEFEGVTRAWLRWYDAAGHWLLTDTELAQSQAIAAQSQLRQVALNLRQSGMSIAQVASQPRYPNAMSRSSRCCCMGYGHPRR